MKGAVIIVLMCAAVAAVVTVLVWWWLSIKATKRKEDELRAKRMQTSIDSRKGRLGKIK